MWKLFKRKRGARYGGRAVQKVSEYINRQGHRLADLLHQRTNHYSAKRKKWMLIVFCLCFGAASGYTLVTGFAGTTGDSCTTAIRTPIPINQAETRTATVDKAGEDRMHRIIRFRRYLDSLAHHSRTTYDSILLHRPGLVDSLNELLREDYLPLK